MTRLTAIVCCIIAAAGILIAEALRAAPAVAAEPTVVRELVKERTTYATTYELSNGQRRVVFSQVPVHFQDEAGDWQTIDPTLEAIGDGVFATTAAPVEVEIAPQAENRAPLQLTAGQYEVSLDLLGAEESELTVGDLRASFPGVATATDLRYEPTGDGLKETLVLRSTDAPNSFTFRLTHTGLELRHDEVDGWGLYEPGGKEPVLLIGELLVWDSSRDESDVPAYCDGAKMKVEPGSGASTFTYQIPSEWLDDEERLYPVFVDPNLFTRNPTDVYISDGYPDTCYGTSEDLFVGKVSVATSLCKTLVKFPQIENPENIPTGSVITDATFSARQYWQASSGKPFKCYRVTNDSTLWGEAATWNNVTISGTSVLDDEYPEGDTDWLDWSCVDYVQGWVDEDFANKGFLITAGSWDSSYAHKLRSGEYSNADYRPKLSVDYDPPEAVVTPDLDVDGHFRIGEMVAVEVAAENVSEVDMVTMLKMGINRVDDQGAAEPVDDRRGVMAWFAEEPSSPWVSEAADGGGYVAYYDSTDYGIDHIEPLLDECDYDPETATATLVFRVGLDWGDQDDNDFDTYIATAAEQNSWNSGWVDDTANALDIFGTDPQHTTYEFDEWVGHASAVELEDGTLIAETTDLAIDSWGPPAELARSYSSERTSAYRFAPGWYFAFDAALDISANEITYTDASGDEHLFELVGSDWAAPTGLAATLVNVGSHWTLTFPDSSLLGFNSSGRLTRAADANGNETLYAWNDGDLVITADNGQQISVDCNASEQVVSATYQTAAGTRTVTYATSSPWRVTYFPNQDEESTIEYQYSPSRLSAILQLEWPRPDESAQMSFDYDGSNRLSHIYFADYWSTEVSPTRTVANVDARATITYDAGNPEATVTRKGTVNGSSGTDTRVVRCTWHETFHVPVKLVDCPGVTGLESTTTYTYGDQLEAASEKCVDDPGEDEEILFETEAILDEEGKPTEVVEEPDDATELATEADYSAGNDLPDEMTVIVDGVEKTYVKNYYDAAKNLTVSNEKLTADGSRIARSEYTYDGYGRTTSEKHLISGGVDLSEPDVNEQVSNGVWAETTYASFADNGEPETITHEDVQLTYEGTPEDLIETCEYDEFGNLLSETELRTTSEQPTTIVTNTYDLAGRLETSTDASGVVTHYLYDVMGNIIETWRTVTGSDVKADWGKYYDGAAPDYDEYGYDPAGRETKCWTYLHNGIDATLASTTTTTYDGLGNPVSATDSTVGGADETWRYDAAGNVTKHWELGAVNATDEVRSARSIYDRLGQLTSETEPGDTADTEYTYDQAGQVIRQEHPDGSVTINTYDAEGNLENVKESSEGYEHGANSSAVETTTHTYNEGDQLTSTTTPAGFTTSYTLDLLGRVIETGSSTTDYNTLGWELRRVDADGIAITYTYDGAGRPVKEREGDRQTEYTYNDVGQVLTQVEKDFGPSPEVTVSTLTFTYDEFGNTDTERHATATAGGSDVLEIDCTVDSLGRITDSNELDAAGVSHEFTFPENSASGAIETVAYDNGDTPQTRLTITNDVRLQEYTRAAEIITGPGTPPEPPETTTITRQVTTRDEAERWRVATLTGGLTFSRTFNGAGQLTGQSGSGFDTRDGTYTYDGDSGRKDTQDLDFVWGDDIVVADYEYDAAGRLYKSALGGLTSTTFSPAGNLTAFTDSGGTASLTYTDNLLSTMTYGGVTTEFDYDADQGWRTEQGPSADPDQITYDYLPTGRLISYANVDTGINATYAYDAAGQRIESVVDDGSIETTTAYTYEGLTLLSLVADPDSGDDWRIDYLYDEEGRPYAGTYRCPADSTSPTLFVVITTDRGDVVQLLDEEGDAFVAYRYDEWGNPTSTTTRAVNDITSQLAAEIAERQILRYAGYAYDAESGLYYCSARHYDPYTRQFISKDIANADGEESPYQYCGGDPVSHLDNSGESLWSWAKSTAKKVAKKVYHTAKRASTDPKYLVRKARSGWNLYTRSVERATRFWYYDMCGGDWRVAALDVALTFVPGGKAVTGVRWGIRAGRLASRGGKAAKWGSAAWDMVKAPYRWARRAYRGIPKKVRKTSQKDFRKRLCWRTGFTNQQRKDYHAHHIFPKQFAKKFWKKWDIDVNRAEYGAWIRSDRHTTLHGSGRYNANWKKWMDEHPHATRQQVLAHGRALARGKHLKIEF